MFEGDGAASESDPSVPRAGRACLSVSVLEVLTQFFFKAPGMGRGGCVYEDAGDKHQIGRIQGIANTSSLHMIVGKNLLLF